MLNHFITHSALDSEELDEKRYEILQKRLERECGGVKIDDTLMHKTGKHREVLSRQGWSIAAVPRVILHEGFAKV